MKIKWNKYTWYSRLAALIFFVGVMPVLTFYIGKEYGETMYEIKNQHSYVPLIFPPASLRNVVPVITEHKPANIIITTEDNNSTVTLHEGDQFLLQLGNLDWSFSLSNEGIVKRIQNDVPMEGVQGIYTALTPGTTVLSGTGRPRCEAGEMCAMFIVSFKTTLKVVQ